MLQPDASVEALQQLPDRLRAIPPAQRYTMAAAAACSFHWFLSSLQHQVDTLFAQLEARFRAAGMLRDSSEGTAVYEPVMPIVGLEGQRKEREAKEARARVKREGYNVSSLCWGVS